MTSLPQQPGLSPTYDTRAEQMFFRFSDEELARLDRFGARCSFAAGDMLARIGEAGRGLFLILEGEVEVRRKEKAGDQVIVVHERGSFLGELAQLSGRPFLVDAVALSAVEAVEIRPDQLRALLIAEADLGERLMRALILRRVGLIESGAGPLIIGSDGDSDVLRLVNFLRRNGHPYQTLDPASDGCAQTLVQRFEVSERDLPIVLCPSGLLLRNPSEAQLARCIGLIGDLDGERLYDLIIVGAGPSGLATSVYAGSEGLSVLLLDCRSFGGQAGASARIENYLGFPTGISGMALMGRAFSQAQKFGVEIAIPEEAVVARMRDRFPHRPNGQWRGRALAQRGPRDGRALPPPRRFQPRPVRGRVGPLLGLAARGRPRRGRRPWSSSAAAIRRARRPPSSPPARSASSSSPGARSSRPCRPT